MYPSIRKLKNFKMEEKEMVKIVRCKQCGKFFNQEKDATCPLCSGAIVVAPRVMPVMTHAATGNDKICVTVRETRETTDDEITQPVFRINTGNDSVVDRWSCLTGSENGRDFYKAH